MKKLTIVFLLNLAPILLKAQVGIGTTDPQATLHVVSKSDKLLVIDKEDNNGDIVNAITINKNGELSISQNYTLPQNDGNNGDVLVTDGNGILTWKPLTNNASGILIKKLNSSNSLKTTNNPEMLMLSDTGLTPNAGQEELLKLPNTSSSSNGAWNFNSIEGGVHGKHIHLINDSVKELKINCISQNNANPNKIVELSKNQSHINLSLIHI